MSLGASTVILSEIYSKDQIKKINNIITEQQIAPTTGGASNVTKKGTFNFIHTMDIVNELYGWFNHCQIVNNEYFGYDISWQYNIDSCIYNEYDVGDEYGWHVDVMTEQGQIDSKLTCLLNLSEESYEGGDFYTVGSNEKWNFDSGCGIIFNSLLAHKVTPVTKGERTTLTYWGSGPTWR